VKVKLRLLLLDKGLAGLIIGLNFIRERFLYISAHFIISV
jgi:hypothetical protein